jgi:hypothetical protein
MPLIFFAATCRAAASAKVEKSAKAALACCVASLYTVTIPGPTLSLSRSGLFSSDFLLPGLEPLLLPAHDFSDALGPRQILRHRTAQFVNRFADFAANFVVNSVRVIFIPHVFAA